MTIESTPYTLRVSSDELEQFSPVAVRTYPRLADAMGLSRGERALLLGLPEDAELPIDTQLLTQDQFYRFSYLLGIYKALKALHREDAEVARRIRLKVRNDWMNGRSMVEYMLEEGLHGMDVLRRDCDYWAYNGW